MYGYGRKTTDDVDLNIHHISFYFWDMFKVEGTRDRQTRNKSEDHVHLSYY